MVNESSDNDDTNTRDSAEKHIFSVRLPGSNSLLSYLTDFLYVQMCVFKVTNGRRNQSCRTDK
jgi:hypothetical protein